MVGDFASSQASAIWPGVAPFRWAIWFTSSTMGWLVSKASAVKRGNRLRMSLSAIVAADGAGEEALPER